MKKSLKMALLTAALGMAAPAAQASIINFDYLNGEIIEGQQQFTVKTDTATSFILKASGEEGTQSGAIATSGTCSIIACPSNNNSPYYLGLNDNGLSIRDTQGLGLMLRGFSSSFVAPVLANIPFSVAKIVVSGKDMSGAAFIDSFDLPGQNAQGDWYFSPFKFTASNRVYREITFSACVNDLNGNCFNPASNQAQFALDNISVTAVPEPAEWLMMALGLASIGMVMRRKQNNDLAGIAS